MDLIRDDVAAALEDHFAEGRTPGSRRFRDDLDRRNLWTMNLTGIAYERAMELEERWRSKTVDLGGDPEGREFAEDTMTMLWVDAFLAALALVDQGVLP